MARLTVKDLLDAKGTRRFCQVYIRNAKEAAACNAAGVDMVIHWEGGDIAAVRAAAPDAFLTVGLVYGRHASIPEALGAAYRALELGADAVYCPQSLAYVEAFAAEAIPTVGHVGFVPYKRTWMGGFKAVGKTADDAWRIYRDALAYQDAGAFAVEIEIVPAAVAAEISSRLDLLTIGMGAGSGCDAQYLFATDILGDNEGHIPRHAKVYRDHRAEYKRLYEDSIAAFSEFRADVISGAYPTPQHSLGIDPDELSRFRSLIDDTP
ncbi:MAG: 3-methyl-2-oxobutanoate hydroxymethyltransferase [Acidimicrobiales bacterium]